MLAESLNRCKALAERAPAVCLPQIKQGAAPAIVLSPSDSRIQGVLTVQRLSESPPDGTMTGVAMAPR